MQGPTRWATLVRGHPTSSRRKRVMSSMYDSCIANIQFIHGLTWFQLRLHPWLSSSHPSVVWDFRSSQMCYSHREGFISWICERMWFRVTLDAARMCSVCIGHLDWGLVSSLEVIRRQLHGIKSNVFLTSRPRPLTSTEALVWSLRSVLFSESHIYRLIHEINK